ncbi:MAG TPA: PAS domain S-box protein, partial [Candidatus Mcinerneyibacterium sp.]|nr:PAS domain S-box protein [Candidatus Mcinerneyibacterium sp.]
MKNKFTYRFLNFFNPKIFFRKKIEFIKIIFKQKNKHFFQNNFLYLQKRLICISINNYFKKNSKVGGSYLNKLFLGSIFFNFIDFSNQLVNKNQNNNENLIYALIILLFLIILFGAGYVILGYQVKIKSNKLNESESKFENLAETTPMAVMIYQNDKWIYANKAAEDISGYKKEELYGRNFWDFVHPDYKEMVKKRGEKRQKGLKAKDSYELKIVTKEGKSKWVLLFGSYTEVEGKPAGLISVIDIDDRKKMENELRRERKRFEVVIEGADLGIWDWNYKTNKVRFNDKWYEMIGYTKNEIEESVEYWKSLIHPADYDWVVNELNRHIEGDSGFYEAEYRLKSKSGEWVWILDRGKIIEKDGDGNPVRISGTHVDITNLKKAEKEIVNLKGLLENITNSMPSVLLTVDKKGRIFYWNNRAEKKYEINEDNQGDLIENILNYYEDINSVVKKSIKNEKIQQKEAVKRVEKNNRIYEDITIYPLIRNGVEGAVIRVDDVTEKIKLREIIMQSEKMMAIGGLAAGIAHEINNPLAAILANSEVLKSRLILDKEINIKKIEDIGISRDKFEDYIRERKILIMVDNIIDSSKRASKIVKNMLEFSRNKEGEFFREKIDEVLEKTIEIVKSDYSIRKKYDFKDIKIIRDYDEDIPPVRCNKGKLQQVFLNLIKNGTYAMM